MQSCGMDGGMSIQTNGAEGKEKRQEIVTLNETNGGCVGVSFEAAQGEGRGQLLRLQLPCSLKLAQGLGEKQIKAEQLIN